jgi:hypothetical protein
MSLILYILFIVLYMLAWSYGMWIAFTKGDDVIAKFGRWFLGRNK